MAELAPGPPALPGIAVLPPVETGVAGVLLTEPVPTAGVSGDAGILGLGLPVPAACQLRVLLPPLPAPPPPANKLARLALLPPAPPLTPPKICIS